MVARVTKITSTGGSAMDRTEPLTFTIASPTEIRCTGANGLAFYLPVVPLCGTPNRKDQDEARPA
jgi:hypothetical protein